MLFAYVKRLKTRLPNAFNQSSSIERRSLRQWAQGRCRFPRNDRAEFAAGSEARVDAYAIFRMGLGAFRGDRPSLTALQRVILCPHREDEVGERDGENCHTKEESIGNSLPVFFGLPSVLQKRHPFPHDLLARQHQAANLVAGMGEDVRDVEQNRLL